LLFDKGAGYARREINDSRLPLAEAGETKEKKVKEEEKGAEKGKTEKYLAFSQRSA